MTLSVLGAIIDTVVGSVFMEIDVKPSTWAAIEKLNLGKEDLEKLLQAIDFTKKNGMGDTFENVIREFQTNSNFFVNIMKNSAMSQRFGEDFEFAKLMVTKINPNTILGFKLSMLLPKRELRESNPKLFNKILEQRNFFVNYFKNECDLSLEAFPSAKVKSICEMGFMRKEEIAIIKEKRSKEVNKFATKNDYNRGTYTLEKY